MQDAARAAQLEADMAVLSRSAEAAERQQRRAERIEAESREKLRQDKERVPRTSLEKRIMERERRQQQHEQDEKCNALELKIGELVEQAVVDQDQPRACRHIRHAGRHGRQRRAHGVHGAPATWDAREPRRPDGGRGAMPNLRRTPRR